MLLLSDNDILIKLGLLGLLPDFIEVLELDNEQIYITRSASYALPRQLKKYTRNQAIYHPILDLVASFKVLEEVDVDIIGKLQRDDIDSGESIIAAKLIEDNQYYMATGDKRFLKAIKQTEFVFHFSHKIYSFEIILLLLCQKIGYSHIKEKIIYSCSQLDKPLDNLFRLAFKDGSSEDSDMECLKSYSSDISDLLINI